MEWDVLVRFGASTQRITADSVRIEDGVAAFFLNGSEDLVAYFADPLAVVRVVPVTSPNPTSGVIDGVVREMTDAALREVEHIKPQNNE